jgi:ssDNA-binding Zn-finger/Zn-ribbon topoisomerase 1
MKCPYCGSKAELRNSSIIYGKDYGMMYICNNYPLCDSYVGIHKRSFKPLGTLANKELRLLRSQAHTYFDAIWKYRKKQGDRYARKKGYKWLSKKLNTKLKYTHIGMFDKNRCNKVIELCEPYYIKIMKGIYK